MGMGMGMGMVMVMVKFHGYGRQGHGQWIGYVHLRLLIFRRTQTLSKTLFHTTALNGYRKLMRIFHNYFPDFFTKCFPRSNQLCISGEILTNLHLTRLRWVKSAHGKYLSFLYL